MQNKPLSHYPTQNDEIDLFELTAVLWRRKWLVVGVIVIAVVIAITYLVITPKIYESEVRISEPQTVNIAQLNVGRVQLGPYVQSVSSSSVFTLFQEKLQSRTIAMEYFKGHVEPLFRKNGSVASVDGLLDSVFLKSISVVFPDSKSIYLAVTYRYTDPTLSFKWLNGYLRYVEQQTKEELVDAALFNKLQAVSEYEKEIKSLRGMYNQRLQDKIVRLDESLKIAEKLNIQKPTVSSYAGKMPSNVLDESLLYMRGYDVLNAEIESLKKRESIDAFINKIRPLQEKINYLDSIEYSVDSLEVIKVDGWAIFPERSVKPKKRLILVLAGLFGFMVGIFVVLFIYFVGKRKSYRN